MSEQVFADASIWRLAPDSTADPAAAVAAADAVPLRDAQQGRSAGDEQALRPAAAAGTEAEAGRHKKKTLTAEQQRMLDKLRAKSKPAPRKEPD